MGIKVVREGEDEKEFIRSWWEYLYHYHGFSGTDFDDEVRAAVEHEVRTTKRRLTARDVRDIILKHLLEKRIRERACRP